MKYKNHNEGDIITKKDYSKKIIFSLTDFIEKGHLLQKVTIPPQTKQRFHKHFEQTEVYYILEGTGQIFINNKEFITTSGDAFIVNPGDRHRLWNRTDSEFALVVFKINMPKDTDDTEWIKK